MLLFRTQISELIGNGIGVALHEIVGKLSELFTFFRIAENEKGHESQRTANATAAPPSIDGQAPHGNNPPPTTSTF